MKTQFTQNELDEMRKDSKNYKWGIFYFSSKDPRFFISKRNIAMGWTLNFANPYSYLIIFLIIAIISVSLESQLLVRQKTQQGESPLAPAPTMEPESGELSTYKIANPASVNCVKKGGKFSIIDKPEGQVGMCALSNGTVCEEWAYFRGECGKGIKK